MYYLYILQNRSGGYYVGYSHDLEQRVATHSKHKPTYKLVYYKAYTHKAAAQKREHALKHYGSAWTALKKRINVKRAG